VTTVDPPRPALRISVITPCRNAERYIQRTVESVVQQSAVRSGRVALEYVVVDGASTDRTVELAAAAAQRPITTISEPDRGMYDALAKGLRRATGDVVAYLNAGDTYCPTAFEVIADVFARPDVQWLTGLRVVCNEAGAVVSAVLPPPYRRTFLLKGAHDGRRLDFVQQESTFWRRALLAEIDLDTLASYRLAGDAWLWARFAKVAELHVVQAYLGGFTRHAGQLSENVGAMRTELARFAAPLTWRERIVAMLDRGAMFLPPEAKKRMSPARVLRYDFMSRTWV
jgi:glycosyltransferase involved in cell wall biosynthesis